MEIKIAEFVISNSEVDKCPKQELPEYAFIGRSNVGKSSLINMMTNNKKLAKTSSRPGKTQLINHFLINREWFLVDLPGYGYAKTSKSNKKVFQMLITDYFEKRKQIVNAFVLIDARHEAQSIDLEFMAYLAEIEMPFSIIFTKADKIGTTTMQSNLAAYEKALHKFGWEEIPPYFVTSSETSLGKDNVLNYISDINQELKTS